MTMTTVSVHDGADVPTDARSDDSAARARRRTFTAEYKAGILDEYEALPAGAEQRGGVAASRRALCLPHR